MPKRFYALLVVFFSLLGGCGNGANEELRVSVRESIEAKMAEPFKARGVSVEEFALRHQQAERYAGTLQVQEGGAAKQYAVEVQFDGTYFLWKIPAWED